MQIYPNNHNMKFDTLIEQALNGLAQGKTLEDLAKKHNVDVKELEQQLSDGIDIESGEHTKEEVKKPKYDRETAKKIAMDHLFEDPEYYTKLAKIEKK